MAQASLQKSLGLSGESCQGASFTVTDRVWLFAERAHHADTFTPASNRHTGIKPDSRTACYQRVLAPAFVATGIREPEGAFG
jgi:hypothetical protein